jgi:hypothetical protein
MSPYDRRLNVRLKHQRAALPEIEHRARVTLGSKHAIKRLQLRMPEVDAFGLACVSVRHSKCFGASPRFKCISRFPDGVRCEERAIVTARSAQQVEADEARNAIEMAIAIFPDRDEISFATERNTETIHGNKHDVLQRLVICNEEALPHGYLKHKPGVCAGRTSIHVTTRFDTPTCT